jgi:hypothetical protein
MEEIPPIDQPLPTSVRSVSSSAADVEAHAALTATGTDCH